MLKVKLDKKTGVLDVAHDLFEYRFTRASAGFPARMALAGSARPLLDRNAPWISARLQGRGVIRPVLPDGFAPVLQRESDSLRLTFDDIPWQDAGDRRVPGYRLALRYELYADGVAFVRAFFFAETLRPDVLSDFVLEPSLTLEPGQEAHWAYWERPKTNAADLIQSLGGFGRYLPGRGVRRFPGAILPFVSFDFGAGGCRDRHLEFFVESFNSLTRDFHNTETAVAWQGRTARVAWNFHKAAKPFPGHAYFWGNTWGWALRRFPVERKRAPFRFFHYLDNFKRYPDPATIRRAAAEGADLFMLHENWRLDAKNGELIYDRERFRKTLSAIHRYGMRAAFYVRGNEDSVREEDAAGLLSLLKRNWDGLYMDFGSPGFFQSMDEVAPGGRIQFRDFYYQSRRLRERVGPNGVYLSHSGSLFSAVGHTTVDGYVAGEQEKGQMIRDKSLHAYFSGLSVCPSTLWTAAFPTYRSPAALPYLATTAQSPFVILGSQFPSSSLEHPDLPSAITFHRPLWRLWELLDGAGPIKVYSTQSAPSVFVADGEQTGACLMADRAGNALLIGANYAARPRRIRLAVKWADLPFTPGQTAFALDSNYARNRASRLPANASLAADAAGYGLCGWLFVRRPAAWKRKLERFCRPYPSFPAAEKAYRARIAGIRRRRFEPPAWKTCWLRALIPDFPNNYEESLMVDLYDNDIQLQLCPAGRSPVVLGYLGKEGLARTPPPASGRIAPGSWTSWIPLHAHARRGAARDGRVRFCLATVRQKHFEFYSWVQGELSPVAGPDPQGYALEYNNEIDSDWSRLPFDIRPKA